MPRAERMSRIARLAQAVAVAGVVAYAVQGAIPLSDRALSSLFETWAYPALFLLSGALCAARSAAVRADRLAWALLSVGLFAWAGGEIYWNAAIGDSVPPSFTPADALWLAFYPACLAGLVLLVRGRVRRLHAGLAVDAVIGALGMSALGAALVFGALLGTRSLYPEDFPMDAAAFFGDLVLLGVVTAVLAMTGWRPGRALATVGAGLALSAVVDGLFIWQAATGSALDSTIVAALWPAAAVLVGVAAWQPPGGVVIASMEGWRAIALPSTFAASALGLIVAGLFAPINALALGLAVGTLGAVIARMAVTLAQHARLLESSRHDALTDALTGLGNRRLLMERLDAEATAASESAPRTILLFDLDGFKQYNDWHGHPAGDALLRRLGGRLAGAVDDPGCAYRLGGDEFCVIVAGGELEARRARGRALEALTDSSDGFEVSASCGLVTLPADAGTASAALQLADERLYAHKARRRRFSVNRQTTNALVQALAEREPELRNHLEDVSDLAQRLGEALGMAGDELEDLVRAAALHDVGKVSVPDAILRKPGPLTEAEWEHMREHAAAGDRILSTAPSLQGVARVVRGSHERYDGRGYPDRLMGEEIPLGARIVAVCDSFHAMTTERPYRAAVSPEDALDEIQRCAGRQFDPMVVAAFTQLVAAELGVPVRAASGD